MTLVSRIQELSQENGTNIKQLELKAGIGNGTIRRWDASPPSADKLLKIANLLNVTMDYLMTGSNNGESYISEEDRELLTLFHQLPIKSQYRFIGELDGYIKRMNEESETCQPTLRTGTTNQAK